MKEVKGTYLVQNCIELVTEKLEKRRFEEEKPERKESYDVEGSEN